MSDSKTYAPAYMGKLDDNSSDCIHNSQEWHMDPRLDHVTFTHGDKNVQLFYRL